MKQSRIDSIIFDIKESFEDLGFEIKEMQKQLAVLEGKLLNCESPVNKDDRNEHK